MRGQRRGSKERFCRLLLLIPLSIFLFACLATPVLASEGSAEGWGIWEIIGRFFNLVLLFGILIYFVRKPLGAFFENRRQQIQQRLTEAENEWQKAQTKVREIEQRIANIEREISAIRQNSQQEILEEARRLEETSRQEAEKILTAARREIEGMLKAAQKELRVYAGSLSVNLAQEMIEKNINDGDQDRIFNNFLREMERMK